MIIDFSLSFKDYEENILNFRGVWPYSCPTCSAGRWNRHGSYSRHFIILYDEILKEEKLLILRLLCCSCNRTHAILPSETIPWGIYSICTLLKVLETFLETKSITKTCAKYNLSWQCIYWFNQRLLAYIDSLELLFREQGLWLPIQKPSSIEALSILRRNIFLQESFFRSFKKLLFLTRKRTRAYFYFIGTKTPRFVIPT
jgi:hypothetical protein